MSENMSLEDIFKVIRKNLPFIALLTISFGLIALAVTLLLLTPKYEASTQVLVSQEQNTSTLNNLDIETSLQLINTYGEIIESPIVLEDVISNLKMDMTTAELTEKILVSTQETSQVINVIVTDEQQDKAAAIANEIATVFQDKVTEVMNVDNVSVLAPATPESDPVQVSPQPLVNSLIGLFLGALTALSVVFFRIFIDKSVKTEEDVQKYLDLSVLGTITEFKK